MTLSLSISVLEGLGVVEVLGKKMQGLAGGRDQMGRGDGGSVQKNDDGVFCLQAGQDR